MSRAPARRNVLFAQVRVDIHVADRCGENGGLASVVVEIGVVSFILGLLMVYRPYRLPKVGYKLLVDEDSMAGVYQTKT